MTTTMTPELAAAFDIKGKVVYDFVIPARASWSHVVKKGQTIRIIDLEGNQAVDCLLYNANGGMGGMRIFRITWGQPCTR